VRQAEDQLARGRADAAELLLADLEAADPADDRLLAALERVYDQTGRPDRFTAKLERRLGELPRIGPAGVARVGLRLAARHLARGRPIEAARVLDVARAAVGDEPDLLYAIAVLYRQAGAAAAAGEAVAAVTRLDPRHAAAAAALAEWEADDARDLESAGDPDR
jgi:tetratricopeptide (TPR) repeat protein